ncbi:DUF1682-domain-containing protein [Microthyrium microscopicum]|uniref:DUF1682-domain-containing protein n=1 Tax=Microthyrium microscopicum TaxID=703497 RepID=A0A6A6TWL9_9PEZI|nr:DUF1682-domain-containing protein [Microthyrium microscopicum]
MASFLKNILGGDGKPAQKPLTDDTGFADFANAPEPEPVSFASISSSIPSAGAGGPAPTLTPSIPYTKWYRVWERTQLSDFYQEMIIAPFIILVLGIHLFGMRLNRKKASDWARHHAPALQFEFAQVGVASKTEEETTQPEDILQESKADEFITYATGRNNVAFVDIKVILMKRYNPLIMLGEHLLGFAFDSITPTIERMEAVTYPFDNREAALVPRKKDIPEPQTSNSGYDGFVFAVIHKRQLKTIREDRYDLSLPSAKDHAKLPDWATTLSESAEITEKILTPELIKAVADAGDLFETLIITDQPVDRPSKLNETIPRKRISLCLRLPSVQEGYIQSMPIFAYYLRLPDMLVQNARFRPEVLKKVKQVREAEISRIKKEDEVALAEERKLKTDKDKKDLRDAQLKNMTSEQQRKFLEKERTLEMRRSQKKKTMRA